MALERRSQGPLSLLPFISSCQFKRSKV